MPCIRRGAPDISGQIAGDVIAGRLSVIDDCLAACGLHPSLAKVQHHDENGARDCRVDATRLSVRWPKDANSSDRCRVGPAVMDSRARVMSQAPTGDAAVRFWDAIQVVSEQQGFFELTRPRTATPML